MKIMQQLRKYLYLLIIIPFVVGVLLLAYLMSTQREFNRYRLIESYNSNGIAQKSHTILLWSSFFSDNRWSLPKDTIGPADFRDELKCPVWRCTLTNNHDFLASVDLYDAIVFHTAEPFPFVNFIPRKRKPQQLYVFALMEPPSETKHRLSDEENFYNLTMTYRLDSDIVWPYQHVVDIETGLIIAPAKFPVWRAPPDAWNDTEVWSLWPDKVQNVTWFVSHCKTMSARERLVAELQKHIDVDVYGKCGTLSCNYKSIKCDKLLDEKYKFYLAFENSLCTDYVTEKLFNALQRNLVPVVFGGADYTRFMPPHSYINAEKFEDTKALANYLHYLSEHPEAYLRYFWWRRYYRLGYRSPFCGLCEKLHDGNYDERSQTYRNIEKWWLAGSCRFKSRIQF